MTLVKCSSHCFFVCNNMNLWISTHLLVAGLFLCSAAPTPDECQPLITPQSLADPQTIYGTTYFLAGYTDSDLYNNILKVTDSSKVTIASSPLGHSVMSEQNRINGKCYSSLMNMTMESNTASMSMENASFVLHVLPSCDGCLVMSINSTGNIDKVLDFMNINRTVTRPEPDTIHSVYLMGKESSLKDSELEQFKKQASCLGFSGEPNFVYDSQKAFCSEDEGIMVPLS